MVKPQADTTGAMVMSKAPPVASVKSPAVWIRVQISAPTGTISPPAPLSMLISLLPLVRDSRASSRRTSSSASYTALVDSLP